MTNCPFCGDELHGTFNIESPFPFDNYKCGTNQWDKDTIRQSTKCKDRQIAQLTEKLDAWRACKNAVAGGRFNFAGPEVQKLRDLGEL